MGGLGKCRARYFGLKTRHFIDKDKLDTNILKFDYKELNMFGSTKEQRKEQLKRISMNYQIIVLDLDGTLTNNKKEITPKTKAALMKAQEKGFKVVLASGRPTGGIAPLANELELERYSGYVMAYNGGVIIHWATQEILFEQKLDETFVPYLFDKTCQNKMSILTYQGEKIAASNIEDEYVKHEAFINKMPLVQYDDFVNQVVYPINKCLIVGEPGALAQLEGEINRDMGNKMSAYRSADFFLECVPVGVDKACSLERLTTALGIDRSEVVACGDGYNDLSMIEWAGMGVAMQNANDEVKKAANFITLSNEEDGVAHVVEKFFPG